MRSLFLASVEDWSHYPSFPSGLHHVHFSQDLKPATTIYRFCAAIVYTKGLFPNSFIPDIYTAPLQETYSEALSVQLRSKRNVLRSLQKEDTNGPNLEILQAPNFFIKTSQAKNIQNIFSQIQSVLV